MYADNATAECVHSTNNERTPENALVPPHRHAGDVHENTDVRMSKQDHAKTRVHTNTHAQCPHASFFIYATRLRTSQRPC